MCSRLLQQACTVENVKCICFRPYHRNILVKRDPYFIRFKIAYCLFHFHCASWNFSSFGQYGSENWQFYFLLKFSFLDCKICITGRENLFWSAMGFKIEVRHAFCTWNYKFSRGMALQNLSEYVMRNNKNVLQQ